MKKLVRIDMDVWGGGLTTKEWRVNRETEGSVFIARERAIAGPVETGKTETVRVSGPFNRKDIGPVTCSNQRVIHGAKRKYILTEYERPSEDPVFREAVQEMCDIICRELSNAGRLLADIEYTFK